MPIHPQNTPEPAQPGPGPWPKICVGRGQAGTRRNGMGAAAAGNAPLCPRPREPLRALWKHQPTQAQPSIVQPSLTH